MSDISKERLEEEIEKILKDADLSKTSTKKVIQTLQKVLGVDLSDRKKTIDQLVMDYVNSKESEEEEDNSDDELLSNNKSKKGSAKREEPISDEDEDEPPKKKGKKAATTKAKKAGSSDSDDDYLPQDDQEVVTVKIPKNKKINKNMKVWAPKGSVIRVERVSDDEDDDELPKKKGKRAATTTKGKKAGGGRGKGSGYTRALRLSPQLAKLMGKEEMPRHEVVKRVWEIIKERQLYDPNNKQFAICDEDLMTVIGTKRFRTFGMMKYLKTHFLD